MELLEGIYTRRSVRTFTRQPVEQEQVKEILKAGSWAPSGLNNQPWRFVIIHDRTKRDELSLLTKYRKVVSSAPLLIAVLLDHEAMYNRVKDCQGIGACIQNMLLAAHALGLGAVWLGEILNKADDVRLLLELSGQYELMAVLACGHPAGKNERSTRRHLDDLVLKEL